MAPRPGHLSNTSREKQNVPSGENALAKPVINILLLEDNAGDAELVRRTLETGKIHFQMKCVDDRNAFEEQIVKYSPDLILSDYSLPSFNGDTALKIARHRCPDIPFIFVTGSLGEEVAIDTLKKGATDYVLKHRLSRLVPAVTRALSEARQRMENRLAQENLRASHEQLRSLSLYLQQVREEERIRIAREVHDVLGQSLTGLKLQLLWLTSRLPKNLKPLVAKAQEIMGYVDETIETVRRIATNLRPGVLDNAGLQAAIEWQASEFEQHTGIRCRVEADIEEIMLDQDLNTAFYRIFQEALTNISRHAGATEVKVGLKKSDHELILTVEDNGHGISEAEIRNTKSIGLLGMRERASLLGGEVIVQGQPGKGTRVRVRIPLPYTKSNIIQHHENPVD